MQLILTPHQFLAWQVARRMGINVCIIIAVHHIKFVMMPRMFVPVIQHLKDQGLEIKSSY